MRFRVRLLSTWESISASYWFVPSLMSLGSMGLAFFMVWLDQTASKDWINAMPGLYTGSAEGARNILATIASSMIGLAGLVFSITIVALTLASGQFGSRLLRNFMRDRGNQITLGTFLAAFLYCLLILRKVHGGDGEEQDVFVPQLSMMVSVIIAIAGLGVLIFFIHHAAASIQAPNVIAAVYDELQNAISELYPEEMGEEPEEAGVPDAAARQQIPVDFISGSAVLRAGRAGYVQRIETGQLMELAEEHDLILQTEHRPGHFVQADDIILRVWPRPRANDEALQALRESFLVSGQRSLSQDAEFAIEQLVEVASRALSPGINDPFTAIQCIDRLGAALSTLASRRIPSPYQLNDAGRLRVIAYPKTFGDFLDVSYNQIRQYAAESRDVLLRMLEAMERIARNLQREVDGNALMEHGRMVHELAIAASPQERDRRKVDRRYAELEQAWRAALRATAQLPGRTTDGTAPSRSV